MHKELYVYQLITEISTFYEDLTVAKVKQDDEVVVAYEEYIWKEHGQTLDTMEDYIVMIAMVKKDIYAGQVVTNRILSKEDREDLFDKISDEINDHVFNINFAKNKQQV